jgi:hypothetical protein
MALPEKLLQLAGLRPAVEREIVRPEWRHRMNAAEIVAYVGAGAWLPQIATWVYRAVVRPVVSLVPEEAAQIGFTSYGPIFNLQLAIASSRVDAIIDGIQLSVRHADGDSRLFRWYGLNETFSEVRDMTGNRQQTVGRDQVPIALKIGTASLVEKLVRFQVPRYHETDRQLMTGLIAQFNHLKRTDPDYVERTLQTRELFDVLEARRQAFWWKAGRYDITIQLSSLTKVKFPKDRLQFELTSADVERLRQNIEVIRLEIENLIRSNLPAFQPPPVIWNWANAEIRRPA